MYTTAGGAGEFRCHSPVAYKLSLWRYGALCRTFTWLPGSLAPTDEVTVYFAMGLVPSLFPPRVLLRTIFAVLGAGY